MPYCDNNDQKIYYEYYDGNHKQNLVLIQGMGSTLQYWMGLEKVLSQFYNVLVYDNRGIGKSSVPILGYTIDEMETDLHALITHIGWKKYAVLGYSLGGLIAQKHVTLYPDNITHLILASTHPGTLYAVYPVYTPLEWLTVSNKFFLDINLHLVLELLSGTNLRETNPELTQKYDIARKTSEVPFYGYHGHVVAGMLFIGVKHEDIKTPTLILHGVKDKVVPSGNVRIFQFRLKNAKLKPIIYPDTGHLVLWENEKKVVTDITKFLAS